MILVLVIIYYMFIYQKINTMHFIIMKNGTLGKIFMEENYQTKIYMKFMMFGNKAISINQDIITFLKKLFIMETYLTKKQ